MITEKQQVHNTQRKDHSDSTTYACDAQRTHLQNFNVFMLQIPRLTIGPKFFEFQNYTKQKSQEITTLILGFLGDTKHQPNLSLNFN